MVPKMEKANHGRGKCEASRTGPLLKGSPTKDRARSAADKMEEKRSAEKKRTEQNGVERSEVEPNRTEF